MKLAIFGIVAAMGIAASAQTIIPAGTMFRVRTAEFIDVDSTQAGAKFRCSLDDPIIIGGYVVLKRGAECVLAATKVEQGGRFKGSDLIDLKVNSIIVGNRAYDVVTSVAQSKTAGEGSKTATKVGVGTGLGALIGGLAGGGTGALIGGAAGGGAGYLYKRSRHHSHHNYNNYR